MRVSSGNFGHYISNHSTEKISKKLKVEDTLNDHGGARMSNPRLPNLVLYVSKIRRPAIRIRQVKCDRSLSSLISTVI